MPTGNEGGRLLTAELAAVQDRPVVARDLVGNLRYVGVAANLAREVQ